MIGVEFVRPGTDEPDAAAPRPGLRRVADGGLLVGKGGLYGNVLRMGPPLTLTAEEAREGLAILVELTGGDPRGFVLTQAPNVALVASDGTQGALRCVERTEGHIGALAD